MSESIADFENMMSLDQPIKSAAPCRWERKQQACLADRFIPNRAGMERALSQCAYYDDLSRDGCDDSTDSSEFAKVLSSNSSDNSFDTAQSRVLSFKNKAPTPKDGYQSSLKVLYTQQAGKKSEVAKPTRHIPSAPVRILDAPDMMDDYYLNLLSWSSTNVMAVALTQSVYLWDAASGSIKELMTVPDADDYVSSVSWVQEGGTHLAVGTANNVVQLWDVAAGKQVRSLRGHSSRVGALAWNNHILTSGSRDTTVINHDVRIQNNVVGTMKQHTQEVCGLAWSPDGTYLASGANDNTLCIFDAVASTTSMDAQPRHVLREHQAAVKALAWSPHERNLLATGGGTADRCIKFWNASSGALLNSVDTGSQVCALQWSPFEKELLSSHGFAENQLCLWKYPTMSKMKEFKGHTSRVLHMATSPDGSMVCSGAADETLRFWNIFASEGKKKSEGTAMGGSLSNSNGLKIR